MVPVATLVVLVGGGAVWVSATVGRTVEVMVASRYEAVVRTGLDAEPSLAVAAGASRVLDGTSEARERVTVHIDSGAATPRTPRALPTVSRAAATSARRAARVSASSAVNTGHSR